MFSWRRRKNRELDEEVEAHLRMAIRDRVERGESPETARLAALREFGSHALVKEVTRATSGWPALEQAGRDVRLAARMLRKNPGFTAVVVLTIALGVGANSAIFSVVRAALAPLPIAQAGRVAFAFTESKENNLRGGPASAPDYVEWRASGVFSSLGAFVDSGVNVRLGDRTERVESETADKGFFDVIGIQPELGRLFSEADTQPDAPGVVVLADRFWRTNFANRNVLGKTLIADGKPHTIIGVLPKVFAALGNEQLYEPLVLTSPAQLNDHGSRFFGVLGRLRPGLSLPAAEQAIAALEARLGQQFPEDRTDTVVLQAVEEAFVQDSRTLVIMLAGAVGFVLMIACANIANLVMARGVARAREMTVRAALGASRWQLTRQLLAESLLLALAGGVLAVLPATLGIRFILSFKLDSLPAAGQVTFDWRVLVFNFALALAAGLAFGSLPAWQACKARVSDALKSASRFHTGGPHQRLRSLFVVAEISLTVVLLAGAGLMVRSFLTLHAVRPGYTPRGVLAANVDLGGSRSTPQSIIGFFDDVLAEARSLPGVVNVAAVNSLPTSSDYWRTFIHFTDRRESQNGVIPKVIRDSITPDYFRTMQIPLLSGRMFGNSDSAEAPKVIIVDERTAGIYWPNRSPIGERIWIDQIKPGEVPPWRQIVGVVGSVSPAPSLEKDLSGMGQVYLPEAQYPDSTMTLVLRTTMNPMTLAEPLRRIVRQVDIDQPLFQVQTMEDALSAGHSTQTLAALVLGAFGLTALLLSSLGIYGVMAFNVGRRCHEFGIRMSLGARPADVLRLVTHQAFALNVAGLAIGLAGAWALTGLMSSLLYGVAATDPMTFATVAAFLAAVTTLAAYIPARRATRIDPVQALREE